MHVSGDLCERLRSDILALVHYLIPVAAVFHGALLLNERIAFQAITRGALVHAAVSIANRSPQRRGPQ